MVSQCTWIKQARNRGGGGGGGEGNGPDVKHIHHNSTRGYKKYTRMSYVVHVPLFMSLRKPFRSLLLINKDWSEMI